MTVTSASTPSCNPAQERVRDDLLAVTTPRPRTDPTLAARLRRRLAELTTGAAALVPAAERGLYLNKTALDALVCDGRFLDRLAEPFAWTAASVRGQVAHAAIAVDLAGDRRHPPRVVVDHAWREFTSSGRAAGRFVAGLSGPEADALRADATAFVTEFRAVFPPLPPDWHPRTEPELRVALHHGAVVLLGRPDLVIGRPTPDRRRMLLVDLKTGRRQVERERADLRFYALLATLKYGVAPFRVATFYLAEADWDHLDVDEDLLTATVADTAAKIDRAAELLHARPAEEDLRLVAGPACRWCSRAPGCPAGAGPGRRRVFETVPR